MNDIIKQLEAPFALDDYYVRVGSVTKNKAKCQWLAYVKKDAIVMRLNQVFGVDWSVSMQTQQLANGVVVVDCHITANGITRGLNGADSSSFNPHDVAKSAGTDAFKRAATMWGIGAHLANSPQMWTPYKDKDWDFINQQERIALGKLHTWIKSLNGNATTPTPPSPKQQSPQNTPPRASRPAHNPFDDAQQPTGDGNAVCTKAEVKLDKNGNRYIVLSTNKGGVTIKSRQMLKDAGWVTDDELGNAKDVMVFDAPKMYVTLKLQDGSDKFYDLVAVADKPAPPEQQSLIADDDDKHDANAMEAISF